MAFGAGLYIRCASLLVNRGEGTPAPWNPPKRFVVAGPYRYVRNPMAIGVFLFLLGEAISIASLALFLYLGVVVTFVHCYIVIVEERELEARFGDTYRVYKERIPRWLPRRRRP
jgi:protein-S-isoprenylcysteine O-methyltransferase Ste14